MFLEQKKLVMITPLLLSVNLAQLDITALI